MIDDQRIEEFVREKALLGPSELESALEARDDEERPLFDILVEHGFVDEEPLVELAAEVLNVDRVPTSNLEPDPEIVELLPKSAAVEHWVLPLRREQADGTERLVLAMRDPIDMQAMEAVADHVDIDIRPVLAGPRALQTCIAKVYDAERSEFAGKTFDYTADASESSSGSRRDTPFGPDAVSTMNSETRSESDDADDSSIHAAETAQGDVEAIAREAEQLRREAPHEGDADESSSTSIDETTDADANRLASLRRRLDLDEDGTDDRPGTSTAQLLGRIAEANDGIPDSTIENLQHHDVESILAAGLVAAIRKGLLSVEELVSALPEPD